MQVKDNIEQSKLTFALVFFTIRLYYQIFKKGLHLMTAYMIANSIVIIIGLTIKLPIICKPILRFNTWGTITIAAACYSIVQFAAQPFSPVYDKPMVHLALYFMSILVTIILAQPGRIMEMLIMDYFYQAWYNILGSGIMAIMTVAYGALSGADSTTWFTVSAITASDYVLRCIALVITFAVGLLICRRCMPLLLNVSKKMKTLLFAGTVLPAIIFITLKQIVNPDASQLLAGPLVVCYGVLLLVVTTTLLVFFINVFVQIREENNLIQARLESQSIYYHKVLEIQQELREAKHDLTNRMAAYAMTGKGR